MIGALVAAAVAGLAALLAWAITSPDTAPELDVPETGDDLLAWAAAHPDLTHCPDTLEGL
jgi:hypothetical protein